MLLAGAQGGVGTRQRHLAENAYSLGGPGRMGPVLVARIEMGLLREGGERAGGRLNWKGAGSVRVIDWEVGRLKARIC